MRKISVRHILAGLVLAALPMASFAFVSVGISVNIAPPALPVYVQPPCPAVGYIWTPGYWAYDDGDYYWVPGTWVTAPSPGLLWTPGYWGWGDGAYAWHTGYWGPHVGFYGGVNYGFGYGGVGFEGGYWRGGAFFYNRSVANLGGIHVTNVYNRTVVNNITVNRVSFNGGTGGTNARPTSRELIAEHDHHVEFTSAQREHEHMASGNHDLRASVNGGKPRIAATARPAVFSGRGVVAARASGGPAHGGEMHANRADRPPGAAGAAMRGGPGGAGHPQPGHGESGHAAQIHNDRPAAEGIHVGPGATAHISQERVNQAGPARGERNDRPAGGQHAGAGSMVHTSPEHVNQANQARGDRPQGQHLSGMAQSPSQQPGGGGEHPAPHPQSAPRQQNAPQVQGQRGGEPQPHGQGRGQPQGRGERDNNHGHR